MVKFSEFFKKLKKDKLAMCAFVVLLVLYAFIAFADFFAIYPSNFSDRNLSYQPPSNIYLIDKDKKYRISREEKY